MRRIERIEKKRGRRTYYERFFLVDWSLRSVQVGQQLPIAVLNFHDLHVIHYRHGY